MGNKKSSRPVTGARALRFAVPPWFIHPKPCGVNLHWPVTLAHGRN